MCAGQFIAALLLQVMSGSLLYPFWAYPSLWVPPRRPRLTPKENSHHTKAGSEVTGSLFLIKPLVLGDARLCGSWVFTHLVGVGSLHMKHNERARVAPRHLTFTNPFRTQKKHERPPAAACGRLRPPFATLPLATLPFATLPACGGERSRTTVAMSRRWRSSWRPQAAASQRPSHRRQFGAHFKLPRFRAWKRPPRRTL